MTEGTGNQVVQQPPTKPASPRKLATDAASIGSEWREQFLILALITVAVAATIVGPLGGKLIALQIPEAGLTGTHLGRQWSGAIYVATPQLLSAFGIKSSETDPNADFLTSRPGLSASQVSTSTTHRVAKPALHPRAVRPRRAVSRIP